MGNAQISRRAAIARTLAGVSVAATGGVALLFRDEQELQPFIVRIGERSIRLTPHDFVDPFLTARQGERMFYYQLQFPAFVKNYGPEALVTEVEKECQGRLPAANDVYEKARMRALP